MHLETARYLPWRVGGGEGVGLALMRRLHRLLLFLLELAGCRNLGGRGSEETTSREVAWADP